MPVTYVVARMHMEGSCNDSINRGGCDCLMLLKDAVEAFIVLCFSRSIWDTYGTYLDEC